MNRNVSTLTLALTAVVLSAVPQFARADQERPATDAPPGWSARDEGGGAEYFLPPGASTMDVYEAIFPTQPLAGTLEETAAALWHSNVHNERLVDAKSKRVSVTDGAPAYEVLVATVDAQNQGVYRVFFFKQFGEHVAAGELRFNDVERFKAIGPPAFASLENMSMQAGRS